MRAIALALLLAGCATTPEDPPQRLAGCWISRWDTSTTTMRWLGDPERPGALLGDRLTYSNAGGTTESHRYRLEPRGEEWALCKVETDGERCWQVAEGESGSLSGGRAFIDANADRLRISIADEAGDRVVFQGERDGCD